MDAGVFSPFLLSLYDITSLGVSYSTQQVLTGGDLTGYTAAV